MRLRNITLAGMILLVLVFTIGIASAAENATGNETANAGSADDEGAEDGLIGPGNALYGLQIAFENIGETFTFDPNEKLGKQVANARKRIAEARAALKRNDNDAAENALEHYRQKMGEVDKSASKLKDTDSGLANAQQMIAKHELVLKRLLDSHPGNKGLERAYNNSQELKVKFEEKIRRKEIGEALNIKAIIIGGNDTQVEVELKFKSDSIENLTIAQEIHDKLQLSTENINALLTIENMDKGELETELEAEASIQNGYSIVKVEYKFPLLLTTERTGIITGIHDNLSRLSVADILNVLEIENKTERKKVTEVKKEEKREDKEVKKEEKREKQEERKSNKGRSED